MNDSSPRRLPGRMIALVLGLAVLAYGIWWVGRMTGWHSPASAVPLALAATLAGMLWWYALRGHRPESRRAMTFGCAGGLLLGFAGCAVGFVGPMVLAPGANQGPLLGLLLTGPAGAVLGTLGALFLHRFRSRRASSPTGAA